MTNELLPAQLSSFDPKEAAGRNLVVDGFPALMTQVMDVCARAEAMSVGEENLAEAISLFNELKKWEKQVADKKKALKAPFKLAMDVFTGAFKPLELKLELRKRFGQSIQDVKDIVETREKAEADAAEEARRKELEMGNLPELGAGGMISGLAEPIPVPSNVREGIDGSKVHSRTFMFVEVIDKEALVKSIISKAKGQDYLTLDLIDIREAKLKEAIKQKWELEGEKSKKKSPAGVRAWEENRLI